MSGQIEIQITLDPDPEGSPTVLVPTGQSPSLPVEESGTQVDLGEDLIEKTAEVPRGSPPDLDLAIDPDLDHEVYSIEAPDLDASEEPSKAIEFHAKIEDVPDSLESARILLNEGYLLDAKKVLQQLLVQDASNVRARAFLKEIQETELQSLLAEGGPKLPWENERDLYSENLKAEAAIDAAIARLNQDLDLGLDPSVLTSESRRSSGNFGDPLGAVLDGFKDGGEIYQYFRQVEDRLMKSGASAQDYLDLGVGFLEMGRVTVAALLFARTLNRLRCAEVPERLLILSATCLLAEAKALCGDLAEAIGQLEALDRDPAFRDREKLEVYYLLGKYYQSCGQRESAARNLDQVLSLQADFRDARARLAELQRPS